MNLTRARFYVITDSENCIIKASKKFVFTSESSAVKAFTLELYRFIKCCNDETKDKQDSNINLFVNIGYIAYVCNNMGQSDFDYYFKINEKIVNTKTINELAELILQFGMYKIVEISKV